MKTTSLCAMALCLGLVACGTPRDSVVFITKTSVGIDVTNTPPSLSFAYDRVEGYFAPSFDNGVAPPVAASFYTEGSGFDRKIKQIYATGDAAISVTRPDGSTPKPPKEEVYGRDIAKDQKPMFFGTSTVLGLKVGFSGTATDSLTLGFRRQEASMIPVSASSAPSSGGQGQPVATTYRFPSVIASLDTAVAPASPASSAVGVQQYFATGIAAENIALNDKIHGAFNQVAVEALVKYRDQERMQSSLVIGTLFCLSKLGDDKLNLVWKNAQALKMFPEDVYPKLNAFPPKESRALYTQYIAVPNPDALTYTGILAGHNVYVCNLGGTT